MDAKRIFFTVLLFGVANGAFAQGYLAYNGSGSGDTWAFLCAIPARIDESVAGKSAGHDLGRRVACLKALVEKYYVTKEDVIPGDPMMRTIVLKPHVYYAVHGIERYLKKEVKNGRRAAGEASREMEHVLEVALSVIDTEETGSFEAALGKSRGGMEDRILLFGQVALQSIYPAGDGR
jgi:hypothetical protein